MKCLRILIPAYGLNRFSYIFFVLVLVMLSFFHTQVQAEDEWPKDYFMWRIDCSLDLQKSNLFGKWTKFTVKYSTKEDGKEYTVKYGCDEITYFNNEYRCKIDDVKNKFPSMLNTEYSAKIELNPGTSKAKNHVCTELFNEAIYLPYELPGD